MKKLLLIGFLFQASFAFSQVTGEAIILKTYKVHGYIDGVRLDSIDAGYAQFGERMEWEYFDYSQDRKIRDMLITDKKGVPLIFPRPNTYIFQINFLYYNGWDVVPDSVINLLKKRE
jgi:hypothetical protein